jgi:HK97 family phage portal protein
MHSSGSGGRTSGYAVSINHGQPSTYVENAVLGYKNNVWVSACTELFGRSLSSAEWVVKKKGLSEPFKFHQLSDLLQNPNPFATKTDMMMQIATAYNLSGCVAIHKDMVKRSALRGGKGDIPAHLWVMRPDYIAPKVSTEKFIEGFEIRAGHHSGKVIPAEEVIYFYRPDPINPFIGNAPLSAAARSLQNEDGAYRLNQSLLQNFAQPSGVLSTEKDLNDDQHALLREEVEYAYSGENMYKPLVLSGGLKWQAMSVTPMDMQFNEGRTLSKMEICAALSTPPILVGALAESNYANYIAARVAYMEDKIVPFLVWIRDMFNKHLVKYWGDDIEIDFDLKKSPAMRKSYADRVDVAKKLIEIRLPLNEVVNNLDLGFAPVAWGDVTWMPTSVMPVDSPELPELEHPDLGDGMEEDTEENDNTEEPKTPPGGKPSETSSTEDEK